MVETKGKGKGLPTVPESGPSPYFRGQSFWSSEVGLDYQQPQRPFPSRQDRQTDRQIDLASGIDQHLRASGPFEAQEAALTTAPMIASVTFPLVVTSAPSLTSGKPTADNWVLNTVWLGLALEFYSSPELLSDLPHFTGPNQKRPDGISHPAPAGHSGHSSGPPGPTGRGFIPTCL